MMQLPKNNLTNSEDDSENGLDKWNDRLDENIEPEDHNDIAADKKAKDFSNKFGSGDQSDDSENSN